MAEEGESGWLPDPRPGAPAGRRRFRRGDGSWTAKVNDPPGAGTFDDPWDQSDDTPAKPTAPAAKKGSKFNRPPSGSSPAPTPAAADDEPPARPSPRPRPQAATRTSEPPAYTRPSAPASDPTSSYDDHEDLDMDDDDDDVAVSGKPSGGITEKAHILAIVALVVAVLALTFAYRAFSTVKDLNNRLDKVEQSYAPPISTGEYK